MTPALSFDSFPPGTSFAPYNSKKRFREPESLLLNFLPPLPQLYIPSPLILGPAEEVALNNACAPQLPASLFAPLPAHAPAPAPVPAHAPRPATELADLFFASGTESSITDDDFAAIDYVVESTQKIEPVAMSTNAERPRKRTKHVDVGVAPKADLEVTPGATEAEPQVQKCGSCNAQFKTLGELSRHIKSMHQGKRLFACSKCPKKFAHSGHLNRHHSTVHLRVRKHKCTSCGDSFFQASHLKSHIKHVHQKHKPWACDLCDVRLATESGLRNHLRNEHADEVFTCPEHGCNEAFGLATDLSRHCHRVHGHTD